MRFAVLLAAAVLSARPAAAEPYTGIIGVIDGDTFELVPSREVIRVVDYDAPETGRRARCPRERALGESMAGRVRTTLARASRIDIERTGRLDRYRRKLALVLVDGRSIGADLIRDGGAVRWRSGAAGWRERERAIPEDTELSPCIDARIVNIGCAFRECENAGGSRFSPCRVAGYRRRNDRLRATQRSRKASV